MDLDRFLERNGPTWAEMEALLHRAGPRGQKLGPEDLDRLVALYQRSSANLSYASTNFRDPGLMARLSRLVSGARSVLYGTDPRTLRSLGRFFATTLPGTIWALRRFVLVSAALLFLPALALGIWLANSPRAIDAAAPAALREAYVQHDFAAYYRSAPSAEFASHVYTNNVVVSAEAFAGGVLLCVPTALLLIDNGANAGVAGGLFTAAGQAPRFWGLILPHGLIELTSVVLAGAAGLRLGWAIVVPGDRSRAESLAAEAYDAFVLVLGTVLTLAVAGTIEGFVTGSALPTTARVGIGVAVEAGFLAYILGVGPAAVRRLPRPDDPYRRPVALRSR